MPDEERSMTREEITDLSKRIWEEEQRNRQREFDNVVRSIHEQMAARGIRGGPVVSEVYKASLAEMRLRGEGVSAVIRRVVLTSNTTFDDRTLQSIHGDVRNWIYKDIDAAYESTLHANGVVGKHATDRMLELAHRQVEAINQQEAGMDLLALELAAGTMTSGSVHVAGNVYGAVQTGQGSTATVAIDQSSATYVQFVDSLDGFRRALEQQEEVPGSALALTADLEREARSAKPNASRLKSIFGALTATVDLLANIPQAWHQLQAAATAIGLS